VEEIPNLTSQAIVTAAWELVHEILSEENPHLYDQKLQDILTGFILILSGKYRCFDTWLKCLSRPIYLKYKKTIDGYS